ncbi:MAG: hypothetical protein L7U64_05215, partial [Luminiphilus sp.]|nr:hypothetical protein [Luminiphilus sp.]
RTHRPIIVIPSGPWQRLSGSSVDSDALVAQAASWTGVRRNIRLMNRMVRFDLYSPNLTEELP